MGEHDQVGDGVLAQLRDELVFFGLVDVSLGVELDSPVDHGLLLGYGVCNARIRSTNPAP